MSVTNTHYNISDTLKELDPGTHHVLAEQVDQWAVERKTPFPAEPERTSSLICHYEREFMEWAEVNGHATPLHNMKTQIAYTWFDAVLFVVLTNPKFKDRI